MQIFDLGGPIAGQPRLDADAGCPAIERIGKIRAERRHAVDIERVGFTDAAPGWTSGDVEQVPIMGPAKTGAGGGKPVQLLPHAIGIKFPGAVVEKTKYTARGIGLACPLDVAFSADQDIAELPVVTDLTAEQPAARDCHGWGHAGADIHDLSKAIAAVAVATVDAGIKSGPAPDWNWHGRRLDRYVRRRRCRRQAQ